MRADRLVAVLLLLQAKGRVTAAEVAEDATETATEMGTEMDALILGSLGRSSLNPSTFR